MGTHTLILPVIATPARSLPTLQAQNTIINQARPIQDRTGVPTQSMQEQEHNLPYPLAELWSPTIRTTLRARRMTTTFMIRRRITTIQRAQPHIIQQIGATIQIRLTQQT